jgi:outer membrane protein assembly factor BamB
VRWQQTVESYGLPGYWFIQDGFLVTGTATSQTVLNALTGEVIWDNNITTNGGMAVGDKKVFITTYDFIRALDIETGKIVWEIPGPGRGGATAPYFMPGDNLLLLDQTTYRVVDAKSGKLRYETERTFDYQEPPRTNQGVIHQGRYLRITPKGLEVLDPMTAKILHRFEGAYDPLFQYPFVNHGMVYLNAYWAVVVLDIDRLETVWTHAFSRDFEAEGPKIEGGPVLFQDAVYIILSDASIRALDVRSGEEIGKWQGRKVERRWGIGTPISPGFAVDGDRFYVSFGTNELCAFRK